MSDPRRRAPKEVRWKDTHSGSSRASTVGGSSTSSGHSGSQYTPEYNIGALEESLRSTVRELDDWKKKAKEAEVKLRMVEVESKAHITALEHAHKNLAEDKDDLEKQFRDLKKENARLQRKLEKYESQSEPSSPDSGKPRRSDSKKSRDSEADKHNDRLKERLNRTGETSSESTSSKPPSTSKSKHSSRRRASVSSERPPYLEGWGPGGPSATPLSPASSNSRRPQLDHIMTSMPAVSNTMQLPLYSSTPRSAVIPPMRPTVEYATYGPPPETGNYQFHPLPRRQ